MMDNKRYKLHDILCNVLGSRYVYFQPPESIRMSYPAIVYTRSGINNNFANDSIYTQSTSYTVTVIDEDPDSEIVTKVANLQNCHYDRHYTSDGLNHDVFTIYY